MFLKNKDVPGIFSVDCLKGVAYWIIPLSLYVSCLFIMSFSYEASPFLPFSMVAMIHPIVLGKSHLQITMFQKFSKCEVKAAWGRNFTIVLPPKFYVKSNFGELKRS